MRLRVKSSNEKKKGVIDKKCHWSMPWHQCLEFLSAHSYFSVLDASSDQNCQECTEETFVIQSIAAYSIMQVLFQSLPIKEE